MKPVPPRISTRKASAYRRASGFVQRRSVDRSPGPGPRPDERRDAITQTATWQWAPEKWASTQAVLQIPLPAQRQPANQRAPEREEPLVDVVPLVISHAQAAKLTESGKCALDDPPPPAQAAPML